MQLRLSRLVETFTKVTRILPQCAPPINTSAVLKILLNHLLGKAKQALQSNKENLQLAALILAWLTVMTTRPFLLKKKLLPQGSRYKVQPGSGLTLARCIPKSPAFYAPLSENTSLDHHSDRNITAAYFIFI